MTVPTAQQEGIRARQIGSALMGYRILAISTGITLATMTFVGIPLQIAGKADTFVGVGWTLHGWMYVAYLVMTANLGLRLRWSLTRIVIVALAGTVPFCSFIAERKVTRLVKDQLAGR